MSLAPINFSFFNIPSIRSRSEMRLKFFISAAERKYLVLVAVSRRTSRWAIMVLTVETIRNGSTPMSIRRGMVESTRWPVKAALMASPAVSPSRISPTINMSGSWRRRERRPLAKVSPISGLTWVWLTRGIWYSIGSSTVEMLTSGLLRMSSMV